MKKILILLLFTTSIQAQEYFNFSASLEPISSLKEESVNITFELELEGKNGYVKASTQMLPALKGGYIDLAGAGGYNVNIGKFRLYSGIRLGLIFRGSQQYPLFGLEAGVNYLISDNFFVGLRSTYDYRSDFEFWGGNAEYRYNGSVRFGLRF